MCCDIYRSGSITVNEVSYGIISGSVKLNEVCPMACRHMAYRHGTDTMNKVFPMIYRSENIYLNKGCDILIWQQHGE